MPEEQAASEEYAASHPDRQEVRIVAGATRDGATYCALRMKSHDDHNSVVESTDLVPGLLELLLSTLDAEPVENTEQVEITENPETPRTLNRKQEITE